MVCFKSYITVKERSEPREIFRPLYIILGKCASGPCPTFDARPLERGIVPLKDAICLSKVAEGLDLSR